MEIQIEDIEMKDDINLRIKDKKDPFVNENEDIQQEM